MNPAWLSVLVFLSPPVAEEEGVSCDTVGNVTPGLTNAEANSSDAILVFAQRSPRTHIELINAEASSSDAILEPRARTELDASFGGASFRFALGVSGGGEGEGGGAGGGSSEVPDAGARLELMAFNVLFKGANDTKSLAAVTAEDPDVLCLTELTPTFVKAFESSAALVQKYPYRSFAPQTGTWGVGFASKLPLSGVETFGVAPIKLPAMEASVPFDGANVKLVCVHLIPPGGKDGVTLETLAKTGAVRVKQAATLTARYAKVKTPVVLLGDFNEEPGGKALRALETAGWQRGCLLPDSSCTPTFPGPVVAWPAVFTIDHVFARGLVFDSTVTVRAGGSDHYPVRATLIPRPPAEN